MVFGGRKDKKFLVTIEHRSLFYLRGCRNMQGESQSARAGTFLGRSTEFHTLKSRIVLASNCSAFGKKWHIRNGIQYLRTLLLNATKRIGAWRLSSQSTLTTYVRLCSDTAGGQLDGVPCQFAYRPALKLLGTYLRHIERIHETMGMLEIMQRSSSQTLCLFLHAHTLLQYIHSLKSP